MRAFLVSLVTTSVLIGCGSSTFGGGSGRSGDSDRAGGSADAEPSKGTPEAGTDAPPANPTPEQDAIGKCLAAWGSHPFAKNAYSDFREIFASVTVFGSGNAIEDTEATQGPKLILVHAAVNVLGSPRYALMNPNGWYCIMTQVNALASVEIGLQCRAHLADSRVNVNVGSQASAAAAVDVNVLSDVKVKRVATVDGKGGC